MISEFGLISLGLVLVLTSLSFAKLVLSFSGKSLSIVNEIKSSWLAFFLTLLSFLCLTYSFIISDFSLEVIYKNSNSQLPLIYKITGVWGNHEGSILLWLLVMTFFGFLFSLNNIKDKEFKEFVLTIQNSLIFLVSLFVVITSNPF